MITDIVRVSGSSGGTENALREAEKTAAFWNLAPRDALRLRLLVEEMMGIARSVTGSPEGEFWIEAEPDEYQLHLRFLARLDPGKREQLLSVSRSGRNDSARGFTGRLRAFFDWCFCGDAAPLDDPLMLADVLENASSMEWSMTKFEDALTSRKDTDDYARAVWDELEKSVVAHVADDVKIFIRGGTVEIVIIKKLSA